MDQPTHLEVCLYGQKVGTITRFGSDQTVFSFDADHINDRQRPTLSLGFINQHGDVITRFPTFTSRLMPFFSNLLPEGMLRQYLARRSGVQPHREFFLLHALGQDLPGAVTVRSLDSSDTPNPAHGVREDFDDALRFSLAGVQLKFSAIQAPLGGLTIPAHGWGGSWIVKLPSPAFDGLPENEFSMMQLAKRVGIDVPLVELVDVERIEGLPQDITGNKVIKGQALAVKRFDRADSGQAVHMEDFAQIFGVYPEDKYGKASMRNIAQVLSDHDTAGKDIEEFVRRLVFNALIGNADMHLKNWSVIFPDRRKPRLSPAYDLVSTIAFLPDDNAALKVSRSKRFRDFSSLELAHLAKRVGLCERWVLAVAQQTVAAFDDHWHHEKRHLPLSRASVEMMDAHRQTVPIAGYGNSTLWTH